MQEQPSTFTPSATPAPSSDVPTTPSGPFNASAPQKKTSLKYILGGLVVILLLVGAAAAYYLTQVSTDLRQQASSCPYGSCGSSGQTQCVSGKTQVCIGGCWQDSGTSCTAAPSPSASPNLKTCWNSSTCTTLQTSGTSCPTGYEDSKPGSCVSCPAGWTDTGTGCRKSGWELVK